MSRRTKRRSSMREDAPGYRIAWGWGGKVNALNSRLRRRAREREAKRELDLEQRHVDPPWFG